MKDLSTEEFYKYLKNLLKNENKVYLNEILIEILKGKKEDFEEIFMVDILIKDRFDMNVPIYDLFENIWNNELNKYVYNLNENILNYIFEDNYIVDVKINKNDRIIISFDDNKKVAQFFKTVCDNLDEFNQEEDEEDEEDEEEREYCDCGYDYDDWVASREPTDYEIEMGNDICDSGRW